MDPSTALGIAACFWNPLEPGLWNHMLGNLQTSILVGKRRGDLAPFMFAGFKPQGSTLVRVSYGAGTCLGTIHIVVSSSLCSPVQCPHSIIILFRAVLKTLKVVSSHRSSTGFPTAILYWDPYCDSLLGPPPTAILYCTPLLGSSNALLYCTALLHPPTALLWSSLKSSILLGSLLTGVPYCSTLLHSSTAVPYCTPLLHSSNALLYCSTLLHSSNALLYCTLLLGSSTVLLYSTGPPCWSPLLHSPTGLPYCTPLMHSPTAPLYSTEVPYRTPLHY